MLPFSDLFKVKKPIIAMLHVFQGGLQKQIDQALQDLDRLEKRVDGLIVENYGWGSKNRNEADDDAVRIIQSITATAVKHTQLVVGVNLLPNDFVWSLLVANMSGGKFIQLDHVTGEFHETKAVDPEQLMHEQQIRPRIATFGGIHPKYYRLADPKTKIEDSAMTAVPLTTAIVVTGERTGGQASISDLQQVKNVVGEHPVVIGSGLNSQNAFEQLSIADGAIVGSAFKKRGVVPYEPIDIDMVDKLMEEVAKLR